jgi:hypothetical protein
VPTQKRDIDVNRDRDLEDFTNGIGHGTIEYKLHLHSDFTDEGMKDPIMNPEGPNNYLWGNDR